MLYSNVTWHKILLFYYISIDSFVTAILPGFLFPRHDLYLHLLKVIFTFNILLKKYLDLSHVHRNMLTLLRVINMACVAAAAEGLIYADTEPAVATPR